MKNNNFTVYNFGFGTLTQEDNEIRIDIENNQFTYDDVSTIENHIEGKDKRLLPLEKIKEGNEYVSLFYRKSDKLKNGIQLKKEEYPIKISIAQEVLEQDILKQYAKDDIYISINPSTLYYYPMKTVRYTYTGNRFMPREQHTNLERYKACVISLLSGISYEKCLNSPEEVKQEGNELITEIYNQNTVKDLLSLIKSSQDYVTYNYITDHEKEHKKKVKWYKLGIGTLVIASIVGILIVQLNANSNQIEQAEAYEQQLSNKNLQINGNEEFNQGNYEQGAETLIEAGIEPETVASRLVEAEQYQLALDTDESVLEQVIQDIYENDNKQVILELNNENLSDEVSSKLADEQAIVQGNSNTMQNVLNFLNDENTAERLATAFAEQGDVSSTETILEQYPENKNIQNTVDRISIQHQVQELTSTIEDLNNQKNDLDEEEDSDEIEDIDNQISSTQEEIDNLNQSIENNNDEEQTEGNNETENEEDNTNE